MTTPSPKLVQISPEKVKPREWKLIKDLLGGDGDVGFHRKDVIYLVNKEKARMFLKRRSFSI